MSRRRGMTLIELLVSLVLLGMIAVLVSMMWGQLGRWGRDSDAVTAALAPQHASLMLDRQWGALAVAGDERVLGRVTGDSAGFSFVTHRPVLHRGWATVEAVYTIEPVDRSRDDGGFRVLYSEKKLGPILETVPAGAMEPVVVLDGCERAEVRYRARVEEESGGESIVETRWLASIGTGNEEGIEPLFVEFVAQRGGEEIGWIGLIAPSR